MYNKLGFSLGVMQHLFGIIASVLHLGNIRFEADARGYATLNTNQEMHWVSKVSPSLDLRLSVCKDKQPVSTTSSSIFICVPMVYNFHLNLLM